MTRNEQAAFCRLQARVMYTPAEKLLAELKEIARRDGLMAILGACEAGVAASAHVAAVACNIYEAEAARLEEPEAGPANPGSRA